MIYHSHNDGQTCKDHFYYLYNSDLHLLIKQEVSLKKTDDLQKEDIRSYKEKAMYMKKKSL